MLPVSRKLIPGLGTGLLLLLLILTAFILSPFAITSQDQVHAEGLATNAQMAAVIGGEKILLDLNLSPAAYLPLVKK